MTKERTNICPECGGGMHWRTYEHHVAYKGHKGSTLITGWLCSSCGEGILEGESLDAAERLFIELRAQAEETLLPEQVVAVRKKLGISQREASEVLGGGRNAFQRYEAGKVPVSEPMKNLLVLLGNDPRRLQELRHKASATPKATKRAPAAIRLTAKSTKGKPATRAKSAARASSR